MSKYSIRSFRSLLALSLFSLFLSSLILPHNASADITTGLVSHWPFDNTTQDSAGTNHGTFSGGTPSYQAGQISQALSFDGSNDYVAVGTMPSFSANLNFGTVSIWFKTTSTAVQHLVGTLNTVANDAMYRAVINFDPTTGANSTVVSSQCEVNINPSVHRRRN